MDNDDFFTKKTCDRCGTPLSSGRIMSMFNEDCICMSCKKKERMRPDYKEAVSRDIDEYIARCGLYQSDPCIKNV